MPQKKDREELIKKHPNVAAREMPNSDEAEQAVLGGMIIDKHTAVEYLPRLSSDDFYTPAHGLIFEAMYNLFTSTQPIDFVTVVSELEKTGTLSACGGVKYITDLTNSVPSTANSEYYFGIVKKLAKLRELIKIAQNVADEAYALDPDDRALDNAEAQLFKLAETGRRGRPELLSGYIDEALKDIKDRQTNRNAYIGVPSGFARLDSILGGGFQNSDLIILAARPGQGKTSFAMNCAVNAALSKRPDDKKPYSVAVFSLEMSAIQLAKRILYSVGNFGVNDTENRIINNEGWSKLYGAQNKLAGTKLFIDESGDVTPAEILSKCRALKHNQGLDFVMIDYLQLMRSGRNLDNFVREVAEITRALKLAAKELNVPILLLSQMSRDIEKRKDGSPQLSDLRDSGAIEQDADIVMFLDRKSKKSGGEAAEAMPNNTVYLNIEKHRNGATGSVPLLWFASTTTFKSAPVEYHGEAPRKYEGTSGSAFMDNGDEIAPPEEERKIPDSIDDLPY